MSEATSPISLSRAQWAAMSLAALVSASALLDPSRAVPLVMVAVAVGALAIRFAGASCADRLACATAFVTRSRWTRVIAAVSGDEFEMVARGRRRVALEILETRGRLDLSGADAALSSSLAALVERASRLGGDHFVSWHVEHSTFGPRILIARPPTLGGLSDAVAVVGQRDLGALTGLGRSDSWVLERWGHLRTSGEVSCVLSVLADGSVAAEAAALVRGPGVRVSTVVRVISRQRADRVAGRHALRFGADTSLTTRLGFRTRARDRLAASSIERREGDVASGRALTQLSVTVLVSAASPPELEARVRDVTERARRLGLTLRRENGRQATSLCAQLPGAPAWVAS